MSIRYDAEKKLFQLDTPNTSYVLGVKDSFGYLLHYYYGKRLNPGDVSYLARTEEPPYTPDRNARDKLSFLDCVPFEYPTGGIGDFREHCLEIRTQSGYNVVELQYIGHRMIAGKPGLAGLPATFGAEQECDSLEITLLDPVLDLEVKLLYTAFRDVDVITRSVRLPDQGPFRLPGYGQCGLFPPDASRQLGTGAADAVP